MTHKVAVSLAPSNTTSCLEMLSRLDNRVMAAEICLDLMDSFDLPLLIQQSPCPLIISCRPLREGGHFSGSEEERLAILAQAIDLGCSFIDIEWDCLEAFCRHRREGTKIIASHHRFDCMPDDIWSIYKKLREQADIVKLVGMAHQPNNILPIFELMHRAVTPVIGLAMGPIGQLTRLLAPCFPSCFLTYAAITTTMPTALGQLGIHEMLDLYNIQAVSSHTQVYVYPCVAPMQVVNVIKRNLKEISGEILHVPWHLSWTEAETIIVRLKLLFKHIALRAIGENE